MLISFHLMQVKYRLARLSTMVQKCVVCLTKGPCAILSVNVRGLLACCKSNFSQLLTFNEFSWYILHKFQSRFITLHNTKRDLTLKKLIITRCNF